MGRNVQKVADCTSNLSRMSRMAGMSKTVILATSLRKEDYSLLSHPGRLGGRYTWLYASLVYMEGVHPRVYASWVPLVGSLPASCVPGLPVLSVLAVMLSAVMPLLVPLLEERGLPEEERGPFNPENKPPSEQKQAG